jgi:anhydro-N-acetylmuramic acid kinase
MNFLLGELFADAVIRLSRESGIPLKSIDLIGSHGQTIHHIPAGMSAGIAGPLRRFGGSTVRSTLQIGEPSVIAERTGITTVADFRPRDVAAGGQGAPLVPLADHFLFSHPRKSRAIQNIGGIANVTHLPRGGRLGDVLAFDTGPGNMIIDRAASCVTGGRRTFDRAGAMAARGTVCQALLEKWMRHKYFRRRPPKTTGREDFGVEFADGLFAACRDAGLCDADILATVTALTARSIAQAYRRFLAGAVDEVIVCGGGGWNDTLLAMLRGELARAGMTGRVVRMDDMGLSADAKEAVSFAILAAQTIRGLSGNVPSATGASRPAILGKIVPGTTAPRRVLGRKHPRL